nr:MAG TPA: hypothetical protein [Bacteriophage sp.]
MTYLVFVYSVFELLVDLINIWHMYTLGKLCSSVSIKYIST